jgi:hypothetical protein
MEITQELEKAIAEGIRDGIRKRLTDTYSNPLDKVINESLANQSNKFRVMLEQAVASCVGDPEFVESIRVAVRQSLAKTLVQRFGGELEKQVNALKSDPITRARITLALEEIVKERSPGG